MKRIFLLLILSANFLSAQKIVKKAIINPDITSVRIDARNCFQIKMQTSMTNEMLVEAIIDGEYKNDLMLNLKQEGSLIFVSSGFSPNFKNPNDKLSAHKVISIELLISLPAGQNVQVDGTSCNIIASGDYGHLKITLNDGNCILNEVSKMITVLTQSGNIDVRSSNAKINATSKFGKVRDDDIPDGDNNFTLNTTTGNINLVRNQ